MKPKELDDEQNFCSLGPPAPPQDVTVQAGPTPATIQVSWKPPTLTSTGTSNGANVTGYGVYAKGQRVSCHDFITVTGGSRCAVQPRAEEYNGLQCSPSFFWISFQLVCHVADGPVH